MKHHLLALVLLAPLAVHAAPAPAKEKKAPAKQAVRTWKSMVDYVMKNGGDDSIKAPSAETLGYASKEVFAKSLGLDQEKSKDGREHTIFVIHEKSAKGELTPKEIVLGSIRVTGHESEQRIDSYRIRMTLDGKLIQGMHATGIVGEVVQQTLPPDSKELLGVFKKESDLQLKEIDLATLTK
jgi:hypothetical protein